VYLNTKKESSATNVHLSQASDRDRYSIMLLADRVSRQEWLAKEYLDGRINEKEFLRALLIETSTLVAKREGRR
jgi:hypothetical protein